jgi:predicted DNA-binding protein
MKRMSLSLPNAMAANLESLSSRLGVSRAALLTSIAEEPLQQLADLMEDVPENPTPEAMRRLRGKSRAMIQAAVAEVMEEIHD